MLSLPSIDILDIFGHFNTAEDAELHIIELFRLWPNLSFIPLLSSNIESLIQHQYNRITWGQVSSGNHINPNNRSAQLIIIIYQLSCYISKQEYLFRKMSYFKSFIIDNKSNVGSWLYVKWSSGVKLADDQRQYLIKKKVFKFNFSLVPGGAAFQRCCFSGSFEKSRFRDPFHNEAISKVKI